MLNDLFSPVGTTDKENFMYGAYALIMAKFISDYLVMQSGPGAGQAIGQILGLLFFYCWIVLFVKRYRHGDESGWKVLIPGVIFMVLMAISTIVIVFMFGGDTMGQALAYMQQAQAGGADQVAAQAQVEAKYGQAFQDQLGFPIMLVHAGLSYLVAVVFNGIIPTGHRSQSGSRVSNYL